MPAQRPGTTTEESAEVKRLKRENAELKRANAILKAASAFFAAELDRPLALIVEFIDEHVDHRDEPTVAAMGCRADLRPAHRARAARSPPRPTTSTVAAGPTARERAGRGR